MFFHSGEWVYRRKGMYLPLRYMRGTQHLYQNLIRFSQGNHVLDARDSNTDGFLLIDTCASSSQPNRPIWDRISLSKLLKYLTCRKYSFKKLTQSSQGNNVLNAPNFNIDALLSRDTCVSSTQLSSHIWKEMSRSPPWQTQVEEVFLSKTHAILKVNNLLDATPSNTDGFLSTHTCVSSTQLNWCIWIYMSLPPPWKT
jgi:hypothetical protein